MMVPLRALALAGFVAGVWAAVRRTTVVAALTEHERSERELTARIATVYGASD